MLKPRTHRIIYITLVTLLGGCMVCSTWASNLVWVLMGANWVLEGRWREKWQMARSSRLLQAYLTLYLVLLIGMLWTSNLHFGWSVLQVKLPLLVVPLVMLTTRPIVGRARPMVLWVYAGTVLVVSLIALVRTLTMPDLPYRDAVPYISHIRFALNCCMVIFIMLSSECKAPSWVGSGRTAFSITFLIFRVLIVIWLLAFLLLIRSFTGIAVLTVVSLIILILRKRWALLGVWFVVVGGAALAVGLEARSYYSMVPMADAPLKAVTANGRPYSHAQDGIIENGNYINNYVCPTELRNEWERRSSLPYDAPTASGYAVEPTLVRYLNAMGQTKDSAGVMAMTDADISAVERGIANPVYEGRNHLRKMVYTLLLEREYHRHTCAVSGFTMLQRFELWQATWHMVQDQPWLGAGTGDAVDAMHAELAAMDSELSGTTKRTHCEYLSILAMVGFIGFTIVVLMFLRPLLTSRPKALTGIMLAWMLTILISFITEDTINTLAGILFCTWFLAFREKGRKIFCQ